jgi:hypothetical protein
MTVPLPRFVLVAIITTERSTGRRYLPFLLEELWSDDLFLTARGKPGGPATRTIEIILWARFPSITLGIIMKLSERQQLFNHVNTLLQSRRELVKIIKEDNIDENYYVGLFNRVVEELETMNDFIKEKNL